MLKKKKFISMYFISKKAKNIFGYFIMAYFYRIHGIETLLFTCKYQRFLDSQALFLINRSSICPTVGARCYQLFCIIVGLPEEPPVDRLVQSLIPVYQLIRLHV